MSTIQRATWLAFPRADVEAAPFTVGGDRGIDYWRNTGWRISAVVEVQPVLDALWAANDMTGIDQRMALMSLIRQLEKAAQP